VTTRLTGAVWLIDGNNVMGAGGDGWWNDPESASERTAQTVARWCRTHDEDVILVFDGRPRSRLADVGGGNLTIAFATRLGRDAADDRIVELVGELADADSAVTVVSSDRGLVARLPVGVAVEGAGRFRERIGLGTRERSGRRERGHDGRGRVDGG
jgi:predicted RNA-binding protein with PIN domain